MFTFLNYYINMVIAQIALTHRVLGYKINSLEFDTVSSFVVTTPKSFNQCDQNWVWLLWWLQSHSINLWQKFWLYAHEIKLNFDAVWGQCTLLLFLNTLPLTFKNCFEAGEVILDAKYSLLAKLTSIRKTMTSNLTSSIYA